MGLHDMLFVSFEKYVHADFTPLLIFDNGGTTRVSSSSQVNSERDCTREPSQHRTDRRTHIVARPKTYADSRRRRVRAARTTT